MKKTTTVRRALSFLMQFTGLLLILYPISGMRINGWAWGMYFRIFPRLLPGIFLVFAGSLRLKGYNGLFGISGLLGNRFKTARKIISAAILIFLISFLIIESIIIYNGTLAYNGKTDYVLVPGTALYGSTPSLDLVNRLDKSLAYLKTYPGTKVVVSGGQGRGEAMPEARYMKLYLENHGVTAADIICEDKATSTFENIAFSKKLISETDKRKDIRLTIVTNSFHMFRAELLARREGFIVYGCPAVTPLNLIPYDYSREYFAVIKSFIFDRS